MDSLCGLRCWRPVALLLCVAGAMATGCSRSEPAQFRLNEVEIARRELKPELQQKAADALTAMFGTPDDPHVFPESGLDLNKLRLAAGPVGSDELGAARGLYRQHCAHCHGISGDGMGPTAEFLNPYPRDYRQGIFKAKSTELAAKPTRADLRRILEEGIPGTAMPSFVLLPQNEIDALVEYVKYLSIRGEMERVLLQDLADDEELELNREYLIDTRLAEVVQVWSDAEQAIISPPPPPEVPLEESIALGRELFQGTTANCVKCHGPLALGDGQTDDWDQWNKDVKELDAEKLAAVHALPVRNIAPRNLRLGIFRFGRRPLDIYRRIHAGIAGTPMPGGAQLAPGAAGLTPDEIWHLVNYVQSLPHENLSRPSEQHASLERPRL